MLPPAERSGAGVKHGLIPLLMPAALIASDREQRVSAAGVNLCRSKFP